MKPRVIQQFRTPRWVGAVLAAGALLPTPASAQYSFNSFHIPGATQTFLFGISGDQVAGTYTTERTFSTPLHRRYGFVSDEAGYATIAVPTSYVGTTRVFGLAGASVVGDYQNVSDGLTRGFLFDGSTYLTLDINPGRITTATGVESNLVVGNYQTMEGPENLLVYHGFLYDGGTVLTLNAPWANGWTWVNGINRHGAIIGYYSDGLRYRGFLYEDGNWTMLDHPLGVNGTEANGLNDEGDIVGIYYASDFSVHGFVFDGVNYSTLDAPGATFTNPRDISNDGTIVGHSSHGSFIVTVPEPGSSLLLAVGVVMGLARRPRRHSAPR